MNTIHRLSKGCQSCQQGKWLCIFITYQCNAGCHFCAAPFKDDRIHSAFGNEKEGIRHYLTGNDFNGISFSGGDPFLVFDRLFEWFVYFKKQFPDSYFWVYTNGLNADDTMLKQLSSAGLDEIRFNIAASGYTSAAVWERIKTSRDLFPYISVEIPSITHDYCLLEKALVYLEEVGVDFLNLHDYILTERDFVSTHERSETFVLNKINPLKYSISSLYNTHAVRNLISGKGYHVQVNHCSMQQKEVQMTQRRLKMAKVFTDPEIDFIMEDGVVCNFYYFPEVKNSEEILPSMPTPDFPEKFKSYIVQKKDVEGIDEVLGTIIRATYIPQMEVNQKKILIDLQEDKKFKRFFTLL